MQVKYNGKSSNSIQTSNFSNAESDASITDKQNFCYTHAVSCAKDLLLKKVVGKW